MNERFREARIIDLKAMAERRRRAAAAAGPVPSDPRRPDRGERWRRVLVAALAALAFVLAMVGWYWSATERGRALRRLPAAQRAQLYERTMATLHELCDPVAPRSLRALCKQQAALVLELDECDAACRETARRHLAQPTR